VEEKMKKKKGVYTKPRKKVRRGGRASKIKSPKEI